MMRAQEHMEKQKRHRWARREGSSMARCMDCGLRTKSLREGGRRISTDGGATWIVDPRRLPACVPARGDR